MINEARQAVISLCSNALRLGDVDAVVGAGQWARSLASNLRSSANAESLKSQPMTNLLSSLDAFCPWSSAVLLHVANRFEEAAHAYQCALLLMLDLHANFTSYVTELGQTSFLWKLLSSPNSATSDSAAMQNDETSMMLSLRDPVDVSDVRLAVVGVVECLIACGDSSSLLLWQYDIAALEHAACMSRAHSDAPASASPSSLSAAFTLPPALSETHISGLRCLDNFVFDANFFAGAVPRTAFEAEPELTALCSALSLELQSWDDSTHASVLNAPAELQSAQVWLAEEVQVLQLLNVCRGLSFSAWPSHAAKKSITAALLSTLDDPADVRNYVCALLADRDFYSSDELIVPLSCISSLAAMPEIVPAQSFSALRLLAVISRCSTAAAVRHLSLHALLECALRTACMLREHRNFSAAERLLTRLIPSFLAAPQLDESKRHLWYQHATLEQTLLLAERGHSQRALHELWDLHLRLRAEMPINSSDSDSSLRAVLLGRCLSELPDLLPRTSSSEPGALVVMDATDHTTAEDEAEAEDANMVTAMQQELEAIHESEQSLLPTVALLPPQSPQPSKFDANSRIDATRELEVLDVGAKKNGGKGSPASDPALSGNSSVSGVPTDPWLMEHHCFSLSSTLYPSASNSARLGLWCLEAVKRARTYVGSADHQLLFPTPDALLQLATSELLASLRLGSRDPHISLALIHLVCDQVPTLDRLSPASQFIRAQLNSSLRDVAATTWLSVVGNLLARACHPVAWVRSTLQGILVHVAEDSAHVHRVALSIIAAQVARVLHPARAELLRSLSQAVISLGSRHAAVYRQTEVFVSELRKLSHLWEDLWVEAFRYLEFDVISRMKLLLSDPPVPTDSLPEWYQKVMSPMLLHVRDLCSRTVGLDAAPNPSSLTPYERNFVRQYRALLLAFLRALESPEGFESGSRVWERAAAAVEVVRSQLHQTTLLRLEDVSPILAARTWTRNVPPLEHATGTVRAITVP